MPFYWRLATIPGIQVIPRPERARFVREIAREHLTEMQRLALTLPTGVGFGLGCWLGMQASAAHFLWTVLGAAFGAALGGTVTRHLELSRLMPYITAQLDHWGAGMGCDVHQRGRWG